MTLSEVSKIFDGVHQTPEYKTEGIRFVSVENIDNIYGSQKFISEDDYNKLYTNRPSKNDLFMTRIGTIGKCTIVSKDEPLSYYVTLTLIKPDHGLVDCRYLKYILESKHGRKEILKRTLVHATPIKINLGDIGKIRLPIPNIVEQKRIADILDTFETICNDLIQGLPAEIEARHKQYEYYRDKLLSFEE